MGADNAAATGREDPAAGHAARTGVNLQTAADWAQGGPVSQDVGDEEALAVEDGAVVVMVVVVVVVGHDSDGRVWSGQRPGGSVETLSAKERFLLGRHVRRS